MGIDAHALNLLQWSRKHRGDLGHTVTIGRMAVHLGPRARRRWTGANESDPLVYGERLLAAHFGASAVESIDNSSYEGATCVADMNRPLPRTLNGRYDSVLDFGCLEHIFDVRQAMQNVTELCRVGGRILHVLPSNGYCGHGFYQFSPELFYSYYTERNGFTNTEVFVADLLDERHLYRVKPPKNGARVNLRSSREMVVLVCTDRVRDVQAGDVQQSDYVHEWNAEPRVQTKTAKKVVRARVREWLFSLPVLATAAHELDSLLSPVSPKRLKPGNPHLERIRVSSQATD